MPPPSIIVVVPVPLFLEPPDPEPAGKRYERGFRPRACGSVVCRWDWRVERVRWAEGERGVRRAREPVWVVRRIGGVGVVGLGVEVGVEGAEEGGGERRVMVVG